MLDVEAACSVCAVWRVWSHMCHYVVRTLCALVTLALSMQGICFLMKIYSLPIWKEKIGRNCCGTLNPNIGILSLSPI